MQYPVSTHTRPTISYSSLFQLQSTVLAMALPVLQRFRASVCVCVRVRPGINLIITKIKCLFKKKFSKQRLHFSPLNSLTILIYLELQTE